MFVSYVGPFRRAFGSFLCMRILCLLPHAVNCGRFCFWRRQSFFVCVWNISGTAEHRRRVWSLARMSLKVKIKGQRSRSPGTKTAFFDPFGGLRAVYVW